jgi:hypothetical protein
MEDILTKGNVIVNKIEIGDIHYEYDYGMEIKCEVISKPVQDGDAWDWQSKDCDSGEIINYRITEGYAHYGPNLYDHQAYIGAKRITVRKEGQVIDDLARYEAVNATKTLEGLAEVIESFANDEGLIEGREYSFDAENMADNCRNFANVAPNTLTRKWGIRQQAIMVSKVYKK